jgi:hypothetical protein
VEGRKTKMTNLSEEDLNLKIVKCYKCQKKGHIKQDCPEWNKRKEESSTSANVVANSESDGDMLSVL